LFIETYRRTNNRQRIPPLENSESNSWVFGFFYPYKKLMNAVHAVAAAATFLLQSVSNNDLARRNNQ
jgi:hypothetical protein